MGKIQKKYWYRQTPYLTYVTPVRTTRVSTPPSRPPTTSPAPMDWTTTAMGSDGEEDYDHKTPASWPELINPVPTFWSTSWWGTIDPIRNDKDRVDSGHRNQRIREEQDSSNRIPTYPPNHGAGRSKTGQARSSSSRPSPLFQLLLAGMVQVRSFSSCRLLVVYVVAASASLFQIIRLA